MYVKAYQSVLKTTYEKIVIFHEIRVRQSLYRQNVKMSDFRFFVLRHLDRRESTRHFHRFLAADEMKKN